MSAAAVAGEAVLSAVVRVLAADPCGFTFAAARERPDGLDSRDRDRDRDRGPAGTFITVYPADDAQFRRLAAELDRATAGLPGPVLRSARPYRPGSLVHYRYGAFAPAAEPGDDGGCRSAPRGPAGERTEEAHRAPGWRPDPFDGPGAGAPRAASGRGGGGDGVRAAGRYTVTTAVRQGARGGVFLGREVSSGAEVVVKQARARGEGEEHRAGPDARDALRREAALLVRLEGRGLVPRALELIEGDGSVLLVQERIAGQPLGDWVAARLRRDSSPDVDWAEARTVVHGLLDLVERVHAQGLVLRGLSPGNVVVRPDGTLRLVDLGLAAETGRLAGPAGSPGYRAPEHGPGRLAPAHRRVADPAVDLYALGGLLFLLATGYEPLLPEDLPRARPVAERLGRWLALAARTGGTARRLAPVILGLRAEEPGQRWGVARVRAALREDGPGAGAVRSAAVPPPRHAPPGQGAAPTDRVTARTPPGAAPPAHRLPAGTTGPAGITSPSSTTGVSGA
ncbi:hypothetical protein ACIQOW_01770 [Kitasatospora sp. NPDC091335]|uniref:class III lanthionine synthetase LanKC N-terminal domain-containing protein n=1 Tax=Kitasatospora sp. NPDC091335 TaxID=3364085 RepID=UPI00381A9978